MYDAKRRANFKNIAFNITKNNLIQLIDKQNNRCAISDLELSWKSNELGTVSIDKIDPNKGYLLNNVQLITWYINSFTNDDIKYILNTMVNKFISKCSELRVEKSPKVMRVSQVKK